MSEEKEKKLCGCEDITPLPMSTEDCVKVWLALHESRNTPSSFILTAEDQKVGQTENELYLHLCKRLVVDLCFIGTTVISEP